MLVFNFVIKETVTVINDITYLNNTSESSLINLMLSLNEHSIIICLV